MLNSKIALSLAVLTLISCSNDSDSTKDTKSSKSTESAYATQSSKNMRILLTDAPLDAKSVNVNIKHVELWVKNSLGERGKVVFAQNVGLINLLDLRDGKTLQLHDLEIPHGIILDKIRIVLKEDGHFVEKTNGQICELKTPSAQKTGIKININNDVTIEEGHDYSMTVDFDAEKSVVVRGGNNGCLLKPVLKIKSLTRIDSNDDNDDSTDNSGGDNSGDGSSTTNPTPSPTPNDDIIEDDLNRDDNVNDEEMVDENGGDVPPDIDEGTWQLAQ